MKKIEKKKLIKFEFMALLVLRREGILGRKLGSVQKFPKNS